MEPKNSDDGPPMAPGQADLIDAVDELRTQGVQYLISLPQLVVCGDQSSGKSSVLESISGIRFPVNDGLCTRFATVVKLRRSASEYASVTIVPGSSASEEDKKRLAGFHKKGVKLTDVPSLIKDAASAMGLDSKNANFSSHTLQLEVSGPEQPHLTLVDLPGLINSPESSQKDADVLIRNLVRKYMQQPRSISLIVVSAAYDTAIQGVTKLAREVCPAGDRMLGIITKPDLLNRHTPKETKILAYARDEEFKVEFGWHVVRNADHAQRDDPNYDAKVTEDEFFAKEPWTSFLPSQLGAAALKIRLSRRLFETIRKDIPGLMEELKLKRDLTQNSLNRLGAPRATREEKKGYLVALAEKFKGRLESGIEGRYVENFATPKKLRFRAVIRELNDRFADDLYQNGRTFKILKDNGETIFPDLWVHSGRDARGRADYDCKESTRISELDYLQMVEEILKANRGCELHTTFHPYLVAPLFHLQCQNWTSIAQNYAEAVFKATKSFVLTTMDDITEEMTSGLLVQKVIEPELESRYGSLTAKVEELLMPYRKTLPYPTFPALLHRLEQISASPDPATAGQWKGSLADWTACTKLMMYAEACYGFSQYVFVDNMISLALENCLLSGLAELFTPRKAAALDDESLEELAAEYEDVVDRRSKLQKDLDMLKKAMTTCQTFKLRERTSVAARTTNTGLGEMTEIEGNHNNSTLVTETPLTPPGSDPTRKTQDMRPASKATQAVYAAAPYPVTPSPTPQRSAPPRSTSSFDTVISHERNDPSPGSRSPSAEPIANTALKPATLNPTSNGGQTTPRRTRLSPAPKNRIGYESTRPTSEGGYPQTYNEPLQPMRGGGFAQANIDTDPEEDL